MNRVIVLYDIQDNRLRNKVVDMCKDYGLDREQYSVFTGELTARQMRALGREFDHLLDAGCYVLMLPIAAPEWEKRIEIGAPLHVS